MPTANYFRALAATQKRHRTSKVQFTGRFLLRYLDDIRKLIADYDCKTLLDIGCGKAEVWKEGGSELVASLGLTEVKLHDPGVPEFAAEPSTPADIVICTQVMGSVPIADLPWFVARLYGFASNVVYVGERLGPVRKNLHADMAAAGLMPHGWTHSQWRDALASVERSHTVEVDSTFTATSASVRTPAVYLRTKDKRAGENTLERVA